MIKVIFNVIKKLILSVLLIFSYNKLMFPMNLYIPINYLTVLMVFVGGIPSIIMLVFYSLICL